jgi:hypothetical protein
MSISFCRCFSLLLLAVSLPAHALPADTPTSPHPQPLFSPAPPQTSAAAARIYDQIVRLSFVEGDVRVSRGKGSEQATGGAWGQAETGLPIETGFSLVTGKGRAEIEFEDASTVYLAEDSVLTFNRLTATGGVPWTDMTLVSGTATLNVRPAFPGEWFILRTPTGNISIRYPDDNFVRVSSYLDAMALTPQEDAIIRVGWLIRRTPKGQTSLYGSDGRIIPMAAATTNEFAEWDDWAAKRIAARDAAMSAAMKEAGLASPIPGLPEMNDQGTFFACAPYGTCWEPTNGWEERKAGPEQLNVRESSDPSAQPLAQSAASPSAQALSIASPASILRTEYDDPFPCSPDRVRRLIARDPVTGRDTVLRTELDPNGAPYDWAVCHAGTWIHREHRYVWVAGTKRHHRCPVRWVKYGRSKGYVPLHPHDVAGKTPINLKHGVFKTTGRKGVAVEHVAFNPGTSVKVLNTAPREFLKPYFPPLQHAEAPRLEARLVKDGLAPDKEGMAKPAGTAITFDRRSQSFQLARQVTQGGRITMVTERFGGRSGGFQGRSGGGNFSAGNSWSRSSGNFSGSYGHWSSNSGGGSHSSFSGGGGGFRGGSGGGGGGGFHGGGGGGGGGFHGGGGGGGGGGGSHK